jgi:hypothetical protein
MQQGLRPYVQDENALAAVHRPAALSSLKSGNDDSENARSFAVKGAGGFPTVRKALGNLTNSSASLGGGAAEGALLGKTPGGAALVRRALGDITNSKAAAQSAQKAVQKAVPLSSQPVPALLQQQQQEQKQGQQMPSAAAASVSSRADALAAGGVERIAGRSWEQLEAARLASEDAEISERLAALASFPCRALPTFFPSWVRTNTCMLPARRAWLSLFGLRS